MKTTAPTLAPAPAPPAGDPAASPEEEAQHFARALALGLGGAVVVGAGGCAAVLMVDVGIPLVVAGALVALLGLGALAWAVRDIVRWVVTGVERAARTQGAARTAAREARGAASLYEAAVVGAGATAAIVALDARRGLVGPRPRILTEWFALGEGPVGDLDAVMRRADPAFVANVAVGLARAVAGTLPWQSLPREVRTAQGRPLRAHWERVGAGNATEGAVAVLILTDLDAERGRREAEIAVVEGRALAHAAVTDPVGLAAFARQSGRVVTAVDSGAAGVAAVELVRALGDAAAARGFEGVAAACRDAVASANEGLMAREPIEELRRRWEAVATPLRGLLGVRGNVLEVPLDDWLGAVEALGRGAGPAEIGRALRDWTLEPVERRFAALAGEAREVARRLGLAPLVVSWDGGGLRLEAAQWEPLWAGLGHGVRRALEERGQLAEVRRARGLAPGIRLHLRAEVVQGNAIIAVEDDAEPYDWEQVAFEARARGVDVAAPKALERAALGEAWEGTGAAPALGIGELAAFVRARGAEVSLTSRVGEGTALTLTFPAYDRALQNTGRYLRPVDSRQVS